MEQKDQKVKICLK